MPPNRFGGALDGTNLQRAAAKNAVKVKAGRWTSRSSDPGHPCAPDTWKQQFLANTVILHGTLGLKPEWIQGHGGRGGPRHAHPFELGKVLEAMCSFDKSGGMTSQVLLLCDKRSLDAHPRGRRGLENPCVFFAGGNGLPLRINLLAICRERGLVI